MRSLAWRGALVGVPTEEILSALRGNIGERMRQNVVLTTTSRLWMDATRKPRFVRAATGVAKCPARGGGDAVLAD
jgi:hypothetical protein